MSLSIGLVYDLRKDYLAAGYSEEQSAEFDSEETIDALDGALRSMGYNVERVGHARALCSSLVGGKRWDLVFNIAEGLSGRSREAQVPCLLELFEIPYTFSDPLVCTVSMDKAVAKKLVGVAGVNTPRFLVVSRLQDLARLDLKFPLFAKPIAEGTGKGIDQQSMIRTAAQLEQVCRTLLEKYQEPVLVEEYLPGREFTVGLIGTGDEARVIGTMEVEMLPEAGSTIYSFTTKENCEKLCRYSALKESGLRKEIEALSLAAYRALECRDGGRADVRLDAEGRPSFMEINTLPGLHPTHSDLPMIATQEGMTYAGLIGAIVGSALQRSAK